MWSEAGPGFPAQPWQGPGPANPTNPGPGPGGPQGGLLSQPQCKPQKELGGPEASSISLGSLRFGPASSRPMHLPTTGGGGGFPSQGLRPHPSPCLNKHLEAWTNYTPQRTCRHLVEPRDAGTWARLASGLRGGVAMLSLQPQEAYLCLPEAGSNPNKPHLRLKPELLHNT